jgi:hypothetical protein
MYYNKTYRCDCCGDEFESYEDDYDGEPCNCGGMYYLVENTLMDLYDEFNKDDLYYDGWYDR